MDSVIAPKLPMRQLYVYLSVDSGNEVACKLPMGKSKIVPASKMSIQRSELCGALLHVSAIT